MKKIFLIGMLLAAASDLCAQGNATVHIFPQFADGVIVGGTTLTGYVSGVLVTNTTNQPSTCNLQLYGSGLANRIAGPSSLTLQASGSFGFVNSALGANNIQPLATGYATLTCTQPVAAAVLYAYVGLNGVLSAASVFSSPPATRAQLLALQTTRLAFAIANNTDASAQYQLAAVNATGQTVASGTLTVAARSNVAKFIDEVMTVPANFSGALTVTSSGSAQFSLVGLLFSGDVFTSEPAVILAP